MTVKPAVTVSMPSFSARSRLNSGTRTIFNGIGAVLNNLCSSLSPQPAPSPIQRKQKAEPELGQGRSKRARVDSEPAAAETPSLSIVQRVYLQGRRVAENDDLVIVDGSSGAELPSCRRSQRQRRKRGQDNAAADQDDPGSDKSSARRRSLIGKFTYRPAGSADGITVTDADAACLRPGEYFNDVMVDFYLKYMHHCLLTPEQRQRTHIFNCFFYKKLTKRVEHAARSGIPLIARRHASVANWTRRVDLFDKDFILVPINESCHWFLAVICFPALVGTVDYSALYNRAKLRSQKVSELGNAEAAKAAESFGRRAKDGTLQLPCILVFDSLSGTAARTPNVTALRDYLQVEWDTKRAAVDGSRRYSKDTIRGYCPSVPQQPNAVDCGPYMLHYAEMLFRKPIRQFTKDYFENRMCNWFKHFEIDKKRSEMEQLLVHLYQRIGPDRTAETTSGSSNSDGEGEISFA